MDPRLASSIALAGALLAACSGIKTYPNDLPKNLRVQTKASSGSIFQSLNASLHVYDVDSQCRVVYLGTVALDRALVEVGIPDQKQVYLEFSFDKSARFYNSSSSASYGTLMRALPAHRYLIDVSYTDDFYRVVVRDAGSANRIVERLPLDSCARKPG
jgi:hypothetical protein